MKRLRKETAVFEIKGKENFGHWSEKEHTAFIEGKGTENVGLRRYGRDWKAISELVHTRTPTQIRTHAQKFFLKLENKNKVKVKDIFPYIQSQSLNEFTEIKQPHLEFQIIKPTTELINETNREPIHLSAFKVVNKLEQQDNISNLLLDTSLNLSSLNGKIKEQYSLIQHQEELLNHFAGYANKLTNISNVLYSMVLKKERIKEDKINI